MGSRDQIIKLEGLVNDAKNDVTARTSEKLKREMIAKIKKIYVEEKKPELENEGKILKESSDKEQLSDQVDTSDSDNNEGSDNKENESDDEKITPFPDGLEAVSYTHLPSPRDATLSRMPSSA